MNKINMFDIHFKYGRIKQLPNVNTYRGYCKHYVYLCNKMIYYQKINLVNNDIMLMEVLNNMICHMNNCPECKNASLHDNIWTKRQNSNL